MIQGLQKGFWRFLIPTRNSIKSEHKENPGNPNTEEEEEKEITIRRITVDALKPREIEIIDLSKVLCDVDGVDEVDIAVTEVDARTETVKIVIKGRRVNFSKVSKIMEEYGVVMRSIDEVSVKKE